MKIVGYIKISEGLPLTAKCLNESFSIIINGVNGTLMTPSLPLDFSKDKSSRDKLIQPKSQIQFREDGIDWGEAVSWPDGQSVVNAFVIEFEYCNVSELDQIGHKIKEGIGSWVDRFRKNLFAFGYNIDSPGIKVDNKINDICDFFYFPKEGESPKNIFPKDMVNISIILNGPINLEDFKETIKVTSENKKLILEYQLLKEANQSLLSDNYRKSILDSASALEVSLTNTIKRNIKVDEEFLDEILKKYNSISKKRALMNFTQQKLPDYNYQKDIEDLRNKAIHIGKAPTEIEAQTAYRIVKEVIEKLSIEEFE